MGVLSWLGAASLLVSALLTAGYLLPIAVRAFLKTPKNEAALEKYGKPSALMTVPVFVMAVLTIVFGLNPTPLINIISSIADVIL
jgi:multicomponent Na+:H+ antiporter subunit D